MQTTTRRSRLIQQRTSLIKQLIILALFVFFIGLALGAPEAAPTRSDVIRVEREWGTGGAQIFIVTDSKSGKRFLVVLHLDHGVAIQPIN
jgi:hypothetical protein